MPSIKALLVSIDILISSELYCNTCCEITIIRTRMELGNRFRIYVGKLIDASGQDGIQNPLIVIICDVFHLSKSYECCVAVEHRITAVGTVHSSIGMSVNSPANTFFVWSSIVSWIHAGILQKHVHETETTLEIYTDDFCFIRSFEIGMTNSK